MQFDKDGHVYPIVNRDLCTDCGLCEKVCPMLHHERVPKDDNLDTLVIKSIYNKDEKVRRASTSGGIFTLLAEFVIAKGGIVCAARFDEHYHIHHSFFDSISNVDPYRGSKYAQSDLSDVFRKIKNYLKERPVLFVGTPCQIGGLKSYLIKDYDNLYTCDFICMSISSGRMWDEYINEYQKQHRIKRIFFKDKRIGWHKTDWRMLIEDERGDNLCRGFDNPYFYLYLRHHSARPSCFSCLFRHCRHMSDITLADGWGIEYVKPEFDDNKGCTTLVLQSEKGAKLFEAIKDKAYHIDFGIDEVRKYNSHIEKQASKPADYDLFYRYYQQKGFLYAANKIMARNKKNSFTSWIRGLIKRIICK